MSYERFSNALNNLLIPDILRALNGKFSQRVLTEWAKGSKLPTYHQFAELTDHIEEIGFDGDPLEALKTEWRVATRQERRETFRLRLPIITDSKFDYVRQEIQKQRHVTVDRKGDYAIIQGTNAELDQIDRLWTSIENGVFIKKNQRVPKQLTLHLPSYITLDQQELFIKKLVDLGLEIEILGPGVNEEWNTSIKFSGTKRQLDIAEKIWAEFVAQYSPNPFRPIAQPVIPPPGPASVFRHTDTGFEIEPKLSSAEESSDPIQRAIYAQLLAKVNRLKNSMQRLQNSNRELFDEFHAYAALLSADAGQLDVASLWSIGSALSDLVDAHDPKNIGGMTEPLEPTMLAGLRGVIRDHTAYVEGTPVGREMRKRVAQYRQADKTPHELTAIAGPTLKALLAENNLLATGARHLISALSRAIDVVSDTTMPLAVSSIETSKNAVLGVARFAYGALLQPDVTSAVLGAMGVDHAVMAAVIALFRDHGPTILALTEDEPQLRSFISWTIANVIKRKS